MDFHSQLKKMLRERRMTQLRVVELINALRPPNARVHPAYISDKVSSGRRSATSAEDMRLLITEISVALNVGPDVFDEYRALATNEVQNC